MKLHCGIIWYFSIILLFIMTKDDKFWSDNFGFTLKYMKNYQKFENAFCVFLFFIFLLISENAFCVLS